MFITPGTKIVISYGILEFHNIVKTYRTKLTKNRERVIAKTLQTIMKHE